MSKSFNQINSETSRLKIVADKHLRSIDLSKYLCLALVYLIMYVNHLARTKMAKSSRTVFNLIKQKKTEIPFHDGWEKER